jgi:hypothetical protein
MKGQERLCVCQTAYPTHPHSGVVSVGIGWGQSRKDPKGRCSPGDPREGRQGGPVEAGYNPSLDVEPADSSRGGWATVGSWGDPGDTHPRKRIPYDGPDTL